jgi:folate-binding protein YgfZ
MDNFAEPQNIESQPKITFFLRENPGYLRISGNDRHAFLQRQSTNDINLLSPEQSLVTVLTSPAGRILDVLYALDEGDAIGILTLPGQGDQTFDFLQNRIFFMDQVTMDNASSEICQIDLLSTGIHKFLQEFGMILDPEKNITQNIKIGQVSGRILIHTRIGVRLLIPKADCKHVISELQTNGGVQLSAEIYEILRIETGLPAANHELTEDYTPLETGYQWTISDNKGCYTGQEIIARQVNYDKITRQLVGMLMRDMPTVGDTLYPINKEQPVGKITSTALSPRFGPIALAIVKRPFDQPGSELVTQSGEESISGVTALLPFQ